MYYQRLVVGILHLIHKNFLLLLLVRLITNKYLNMEKEPSLYGAVMLYTGNLFGWLKWYGIKDESDLMT